MLVFLSGLAAGAAHVVSGPDHIAAVAPIAADSPKTATMMGFRWGLGHGLGAVFMGLLGVLLRGAIDLNAASEWAEALVGFVLIGVGIWAFTRARNLVVHQHEHGHEHDAHKHFHVHVDAAAHDEAAHDAHAHTAMAVGMLHGAAGTGHVLAVLPSLALPPEQAAVYLGAYFVSAVAAMTGFGAVMGRIARAGGTAHLRRVLLTASLAAVAIGLFWIGNSTFAVLQGT